ncbi:MAG: hypothetical protein PHC41_06280 [Lachnospiraceae bacterium]|nr:hypothetical protein [Lachnospiraceae bacterium]MDD3615819.1 hypothetical protein [Lachnospiraceae bacterium]
MGRYYRLSKKLNDEEAQEILKEMQDIQNVLNIEITPQRDYMEVETVNDDFADAMGKAVNICRRVAAGCEVSFSRFAVEK